MTAKVIPIRSSDDPEKATKPGNNDKVCPNHDINDTTAEQNHTIRPVSAVDVAKRIGAFLHSALPNSLERLYTRPTYKHITTYTYGGKVDTRVIYAKSKTVGALSTPGVNWFNFDKTNERHFSLARSLVSLGVLGFALSSMAAPFIDGDQPTPDDLVHIVKDKLPDDDN